MNPFLIFDSSIHDGDFMTSGRELSHWDCAHGKAINFLYGYDSWRICSPMIGIYRYLLELCTLEGLTFGVWADTSYIFYEPHGHLWLLEDAYNCLGTCDSHLCHGKNKIVSFNADVHQAHKEIYVGWGSLKDFQFCIGSFKFSVQWYDFHIMDFISYDDKILLLLLMFGRR